MYTNKVYGLNSDMLVQKENSNKGERRVKFVFHSYLETPFILRRGFYVTAGCIELQHQYTIYFNTIRKWKCTLTLAVLLWHYSR